MANRRTHGLTLLEILVALFVFGIVAAIATSGITRALQVQAVNEAATSAQAKLRRITEVFTQELRSAVLGGLTSAPYSSGSNQISFLLLDGGAGYQVINKNGGNFSSRTHVDLAPFGSISDVRYLEGRQVLVVNADGEAVVATIGANGASQHTNGSGVTSYRLAYTGSGCQNRIQFTDNTLLLSVRSLGFSYSADDQTLYQREGGGDPVPMAFDMDGLELEYVYVQSDGTPVVRTTPLTEDGHPLRSGTISGEPVTLARVQMVVSTSELRNAGERVSRSYMGQVEMSANPNFQIDRVVNCNGS